MRLKITRCEDSYFEMELGGEGHTLLNLLQSSLLEDPNVEMAGYNKTHPLIDKSKLFITLKSGQDHEMAIKKACVNAKSKLDEFLVLLEKSITEINE